MRTIHPSFWRDKRLVKMPSQQVLAYIGLWMLSDDAGWSKFDVEEMAAELYPYRVPRDREKLFTAAVEALKANGRLEVYDCGHAYVPKLSVYQTPGKPTYAIREEHKRRCAIPANHPVKPLADDKNGISADSPSEVIVKGRVVKGSENNARAHEESGRAGLKARLGELPELLERERRTGPGNS